MLLNRIGFMQGRLVKSEKKNRIQFFPEKNWKKELIIAKKNQFKLMEWTINSENLKGNPIYQGRLDDIKKNLKDNNIKLLSITYDYFMEKPFFKRVNAKKKKNILNTLKKIIFNANKLGIKYHIFPLVDNSSILNLNEEKTLIINIKKILSLLNKNSKILFEIDYKPHLIKNFLKKFNSSKIGINYDTGNSAALGYDFLEELNYFKYVKNIHIKDRILNGKTVRLGEGNWNYRIFFKKIHKIYKGNFILQTARSKKNLDVKEIIINRNFLINEYK